MGVFQVNAKLNLHGRPAPAAFTNTSLYIWSHTSGTLVICGNFPANYHDISNIPQKLRCLWQQGEISQRDHEGSKVSLMHRNEYVYFISPRSLIRF